MTDARVDTETTAAVDASATEDARAEPRSGSEWVGPALPDPGPRARPMEDVRSGAIGLPDVICFSHLRWDYIFHRPNHLMSRCANDGRVFFVEEAIRDGNAPHLELNQPVPGLLVIRPHVPADFSDERARATERSLLDGLRNAHAIAQPILWYYSPLALPVSRHIPPGLVVYDCTDEIAGLDGASVRFADLEDELFARANLVFTGGQSLYEAKRLRHPNVYAFPSSVDVSHFRSARQPGQDPGDQAGIAQPRIGYFGVIDERLDCALLDGAARARPEWQFVMVGPVVNVDPLRLPLSPNVHYLGRKSYLELPRYIAGWDVAALPFACTGSTRRINPTKTLEYMAAGKPIVSTPIQDVVRPFGEQGLIHIAPDLPRFIAAVETALAEDAGARAERYDAILARTSWDQTWAQMETLVEAALMAADQPSAARD